MSLLREIQASLMQPGQDIGPVLLKLRFLASRLGSCLLEDWVKHESEGYPKNAELPDYRKIGVSYYGDFSGPYGSGVKNAPIPPYLIKKHAGETWVSYEVRQSVSAIDNLIAEKNETGEGIQIQASNLMLALQGKVYENYSCISVRGIIAEVYLVEIQNTVRTRILELTIQLEKSIPAAIEVTLGPLDVQPPLGDTEKVTQITKQIVHGNLTTISNIGQGAQFYLNIAKRDLDSLTKALVDAGITASDANELAKIVGSEEPDSREEPFGTKAQAWVAKNIGKAADGTWKMGVAVASKVLTEAAMRYYGFK